MSARLARIRHPAALLVLLDLAGLAIAGYLSATVIAGVLPSCGIAHGCETVALSEHSRVAGIPVAFMGVGLSLALLALALAWWRTGRRDLLLGHYGLSLVGVLFEIYFTYLEIFVIGAICMWCALYGASLLARFLVALAVYRRAAERSR